MNAIDNDKRNTGAPTKRTVDVPAQCQCAVCRALKLSARELRPYAGDNEAVSRFVIEREWGG